METTEVSFTHEDILNKSRYVDPTLLDRYVQNRAIDEPAYSLLIIMYGILIVVGALGNTLVVSLNSLKQNLKLLCLITILVLSY